MTIHKISIFIATLMLISVFWLMESGVGEEKTDKGLVTFVEGTLKKKSAEAADWTPAAKDTAVISGDKVRTMIDSRAELRMREIDLLRLAPKTTIDIVKLYEETKAHKDQTQINVESGNIWAMVGEVGTGAEFNLNTPVAGAAITGTIFRVSVDEDSSTQLKVYKGEVQISNSPDNPDLKPQSLPTRQPQQIPGPKQVPGPRQVSLEEWMYIVKEMQSIKIGRDGSLIESGAFSRQDQDEQSSWVKWNLARDEEVKKQKNSH